MEKKDQHSLNHKQENIFSDKRNPHLSIEKDLDLPQESSWDIFTKYLRGFFSFTTQILIATLAVCLGLILSTLCPVPILPTWVFETLVGIAIVGTGIGILSQPFVFYWDYKDWRTVKVNYDPDEHKGVKKNGEYAAYNDSFYDYLSYHSAQREPTTTFGKVCFWTALVCTFILILFSLTYFLGEVPSIHFLAPGFDAMYHFLIVGFGPLLKLVGEPTSLVTPLFAHIIGTVFVTSLPFITLELGHRIRGTPPELRGRIEFDELKITFPTENEDLEYRRDNSYSDEFFKKVDDLTNGKKQRENATHAKSAANPGVVDPNSSTNTHNRVHSGPNN